MELTQLISTPKLPFQNPKKIRTQITSFSSPNNPTSQSSYPTQSTLNPKTKTQTATNESVLSSYPTMSDILTSSKAQNLSLELQTLGPFFRIRATSLKTQRELGRAEGIIRVWLEGKVLHLDSIRLTRETLGMEKSIFGIGLYIGAVAIRYGCDSGCKKAELLAINDSDLYHSKLVKFYTRIGFKSVHEVTGSSFRDLAHRLVWGGIGTRMDADIEELLVKWCTRFKTQSDHQCES
ncbi:hypothetical protein RJ641_013523 [Dillenia turbinata]|uniref:Uncharacterized protein n=1 Tax=Dillenia turbinata TaxID=194707 RepID=A0AAN8WA66_9MAGN